MRVFYTVAKFPVDDVEKFCAWCLSDFCYVDEKTFCIKSSGIKKLPIMGEVIMMAPTRFLCQSEIRKESDTTCLCALQGGLAEDIDDFGESY